VEINRLISVVNKKNH